VSRPSQGPRLYLDPKRDQWIIRDGRIFMRTGLLWNEKEEAEAELAKYKTKTGFLPEQKPVLGMGYIYFITAETEGYPIKIGFTERLSSLRIKSLQTGCPFKLRFLGHIRGMICDERHIHDLFDGLRLEGEWFRSHPNLLAYIERVCAAGDIWIGLKATAANVDGKQHEVAGEVGAGPR
jgi:hypothetical protein